MAFGEVSVLEACAVLSARISRISRPCERVCTFFMDSRELGAVRKLAGIHKVSPILASTAESDDAVQSLVQLVSSQTAVVRRLSVSGYCLDANDYETLVHDLLSAFRDIGFKKIRLLRPDGNEMMADALLSNGIFDFTAFPDGTGFAIGPTIFVPDASTMRLRGTSRPVVRSEISISPRLAHVLINISGVSHGMTILDPFCGAGTILAEGLFESLRCIGVDSNPRHIAEAKRNLAWASRHAKGGSYQVAVSDARRIDEVLDGRVDAVVTEPILLPGLRARPSLATAKELFVQAESVYAEALTGFAHVLKPGGRMVLVVPTVTSIEGKEVSLVLDGEKLGLRPFVPSAASFRYPVPLSFQSTRWVKRSIYVFESPS